MVRKKDNNNGFWELARKTRREVSEWPAWKRGSILVKDPKARSPQDNTTKEQDSK